MSLYSAAVVGRHKNVL